MNFTRIKNLLSWLPIIWDDRQWDYIFLIKLLEHKLRLMEKYFSKDWYGLGSKKPLHNLMYTRCLCTRIVQDNYLENALEWHERDWGEAEIFCKLIRENGISELVEIVVPGLKGNDREREKKIRGRLYRHADAQREEDYRQLFENLTKYLRTWWD